MIFASGYLGNTILLQVLREEYSAVFADASSHPSIIDGIPAGAAHLFYYNHCNASHLEVLLKKNRKYRPLIITDGLFALTGEIAPLGDILPLAEKYNAIVIVDDAHSTGILGESGRGTPEYFHLGRSQNLYQTETMSKALGAYGGFIAGSRGLTEKIRKRSTAYMASTSLPPSLVSAGNAALKIVMAEPALRSRLLAISSGIRSAVRELGFNTTPDITPIIPVMFGSIEKAKDLSGFLEENNIIVPFIQYPVKSDIFMVRITCCVDHTPEQTGVLLELLKKWRDKNGTD